MSLLIVNYILELFVCIPIAVVNFRLFLRCSLKNVISVFQLLQCSATMVPITFDITDVVLVNKVSIYGTCVAKVLFLILFYVAKKLKMCYVFTLVHGYFDKTVWKI